MGEIASAGQLRMSWIRWALVTVPAIVLLGSISGRGSGAGMGNPWYDMLEKPALMPPGWAFGLAWTILYVLMGVAFSMILNARGAKGRGVAIALFLIQLALNLAWSPVFFAMHRIMLAFGLILFIFLWASAATWLFWRIRPVAGMLMLPYLAWVLFAATLNWQIHQLNPSGGALVSNGGTTQIVIE